MPSTIPRRAKTSLTPTVGIMALGMCRDAKNHLHKTGKTRPSLKNRWWQHHHSLPCLHHQVLHLFRHPVNRSSLHGRFPFCWKLVSIRTPSTSKTSPKRLEFQSTLTSSRGSRTSSLARHLPTTAAKVPTTKRQRRPRRGWEILRVSHRTMNAPLPLTMEAVGVRLLVRSEVDGQLITNT